VGIDWEGDGIPRKERVWGGSRSCTSVRWMGQYTARVHGAVSHAHEGVLQLREPVWGTRKWERCSPEQVPLGVERCPLQDLVGMQRLFPCILGKECVRTEASCALEGAKPHREPHTCGSHTVEGGMQWSKPALGTGEES
jgi:hypothetical protein